jgi:hypothetical protein
VPSANSKGLMPPLAYGNPSSEWDLLYRLRQQLWRCPDSGPDVSKSKQQYSKEIRARNRCNKMNAQLRDFLEHRHRVLQDLGFRDDEISGNAVREALDTLPGLCHILNRYANRTLATPSSLTKYPRLLSVIIYLERSRDTRASFGLFSRIQESDPAYNLYLFPVTFKNQRNGQYITEEPIQLLLRLNIQIMNLKSSPASTASDLPRPSTATHESSILHGNAIYNQFMCQTTAVLHATYTGFEQCAQSQHAHRVLLEIPSLTSELASEVKLLLAPATDREWQEASVQVLEDGEMGGSAPDGPSFCSTTRKARASNQRLVAYVKHNGNPTTYKDCSMVIQSLEERHPQERNCISEMPSSLETLLATHHFRLQRDNIFGDKFVSFSERRALSAKLILGMLVAMERYHTIKVWDPKEIYIVHKENEYIKVSCAVEQDPFRALVPRNKNVLNENKGPPPNSSLELTSLAKTLVSICEGIPLTAIRSRTISNAMEELRQIQDRVECGLVNQKAFSLHPIFETAKSCLDFQASCYAAQAYEAGVPGAPFDSYDTAKHTFINEVSDKMWFIAKPKFERSGVCDDSIGTTLSNVELQEATR